MSENLSEGNSILNTTEQAPVVAVAAYTLPAFGMQLDRGFTFAFKRIDLTLLLIVVSAAPMVFILLSAYLVLTSGNTSLAMLSTYGSFIMLPLSIITGLLALYTTSQPDRTIKIIPGLVFVFKNFIPLISLGILSVLIVYGGMLLLLIPGIVAGIYLLLSFSVCINEGKTGMSAVYRSYEIVYGHWWQIMGRVIGLVGLMTISVMLLFRFTPGTVAGIAVFAAQAVFTMIMGVMVADIYQALKDKPVIKTAPRTLLKVFGVLGIALILGLIALLFITK